MKEVSYTKFIGDGETNLLRIRIWTEKGKVSDLVVQLESSLANKWYIIVRYDCSHGFFHRDVLFPNGEKEKQAITSLKDALNYAEQDIKDRFDFYRERYFKRLKHDKTRKS